MSTLTIPNAEMAATLETDLEGRLEVMADDGLTGTPDYHDANAVAELLREQKQFPAMLTVSSAEAAQALISCENVLDLSDDPDGQEGAIWRTMLAELRA